MSEIWAAAPPSMSLSQHLENTALFAMCGLQETHPDLLLLSLKIPGMQRMQFVALMEREFVVLVFELKCPLDAVAEGAEAEVAAVVAEGDQSKGATPDPDLLVGEATAGHARGAVPRAAHAPILGTEGERTRELYLARNVGSNRVLMIRP